MVKINKRSKRQTLHKKHKVEKKIRQHHKQVRKELSKRKPLKDKLLEIPMVVPFKNEILKEVEALKLKEKEIEKKRYAALNLFKRQKKVIAVNNMEKLKFIDDPSRSFISDFNKLVDEADIIIEVLDARDPIGTRSPDVEQKIREKGKMLVLLLNKIDLVPFENLQTWHRYLRREAHTFLFKASCQKQAQNLGKNASRVPSIESKNTTAAFGTDMLVNFLKKLQHTNSNMKEKLVVGIVGLPNTGKSSVINSIKRKRICEAGNLAGLTRSLQHVALDNHLTIIDCPGIVLAKTDDPAEYALRNCIRIEKMNDPISVAFVVLKRCNLKQLQILYKLPDFNSAETFFSLFSTRCCPLKKGGVPNMRAAAIKIINDWNNGRILYFTEPPKIVDVRHEASAPVFTVDEQIEEQGLKEVACKINGLLVDTMLPTESLAPLKVVLCGTNYMEDECDDDIDEEYDDDGVDMDQQ